MTTQLPPRDGKFATPDEVKQQIDESMRNWRYPTKVSGGYMQSQNFVAGSTGWRLLPDGTLSALNATIAGSITATSGAIGGWILATNTLTSVSGNIVLNSSNEEIVVGAGGTAGRIKVGLATAPMTGNGVWIGSDSAGGYDFRAGDPAGNYMHWDDSASTLTIVGSITATTGTIGGFTIDTDNIRDAANSFGLASSVTGGDDVRFWAGNTFANRATAPFRVTEAGAVTATSITITGGAITGTPIASIPNNSSTDLSIMEMTHNLVFSVTDADTIAWAAGTIAFSNGRTFSISAGNTGNMAAFTYIYLDPAVSSTVLQITTLYTTANGANKRLLGTAQNNAVTAHFIPYGPGQPLISGANIGALSIVAGNIAASTITAAKMTVSQLSAITADLGAITAGSIVLPSGGLIRSGQTAYDTGTGFYIGNDTGTPRFSFGNSAGNKITWDGTTLTIVGNQVQATTYSSGSGNWTKPTGCKSVLVQMWGGGGGGGGSSANINAGGGGGGGVYSEHFFNAADVSATAAYAVGAGGAGAAASGSVGGNSTFAATSITITAYGGGGGGGGNNGGSNFSAGGGGGASGAGATGGSGDAGGVGGTPVGGVGATNVVVAGASNFGGGGGGATSANRTGGESALGGAGGGGAQGGVGGNSWKGGAGGGGGQQTGPTTNAGGTSIFGGAGGAGHGGGTVGDAGTAPGGGGGGSGAGSGSSAGGSGGAGKIIVTAFL